MTTRPRLKLGRHLLPGLAAVALFAVLAYVFWTAPFGASRGFHGAGSVTENIGYLMFNLNGQATIPGEGFLVPFEIIDVALVAALVGGVMLARRDEGGRVATALGGEESDEAATDGGRSPADSDRDPGRSAGDGAPTETDADSSDAGGER